MNLLSPINQDSDTLMNGKNPQYHYITLQNEGKEKVMEWYEKSAFTSFIYPALVTIMVILVTKWFNRNKENAEIDKINAEVRQLQNSNQLIIISTLQAVQNKIIGDKINGLKKILSLKSEFLSWDYLDVEGDPVFPTGDKFFISVYEHFAAEKGDDYIKFHEEYAYLYSDKVLIVLEKLLLKIEKLQEDHFQFYNYHDRGDSPIPTSISLVKLINTLYEKCISLVRSDCFLDNDFMHEFLETYKNDSTTT